MIFFRVALKNLRGAARRLRKSAAIRRKKNIKEKDSEARLREKFLSSDPPRKGRWLLPFIYPAAFFSGGLRAAYEADMPAVIDPEYRGCLSRPLGLYLWDYYHDKSLLHSVNWMGIPAYKLPSDFWIYQEIIHENKPDIIVEIGSLYGGSTLFLAHMMELDGHGEVISVDLSHEYFQGRHRRVTTLTGDCSSPEIVEKIREMSRGKSVMVIHDGDHSENAVLRDMSLYAPIVTKGQYLVIEDGVLELFNPRRAVIRDSQTGALAAMKAFIETHPGDFEVDRGREKFILTSNPRGYLRKLK